MKKAVVREFAKTTALYLPSVKLTTDNAAMIGASGYLHATNKDFTRPEKLEAQGNLKETWGCRKKWVIHNIRITHFAFGGLGLNPPCK